MKTKDLDTHDDSVVLAKYKKLGEPIIKYNYKKKCFADIQGMKRINRKGKNRIGVGFNNHLTANAFLDKFAENPNFKVLITLNKVSCKGIIRNVDNNFSIDIKKYLHINIQGVQQKNFR